MTDALVPTKEHPAPLDAFETAKPDEPIWTVQGGDPLGAPLLRLWAILARIRAGVTADSMLDQWLDDAKEAAKSHSVADNEGEKRNLMVRATATEEISWAMKEYARGDHVAADQPTAAAETHVDELARIDLHSIRVRIAQRLSNFRCEIVDMGRALEDMGFDGEEAILDLRLAATDLQAIHEAIEPRRMMKKDPR